MGNMEELATMRWPVSRDKKGGGGGFDGPNEVGKRKKGPMDQPSRNQ